MLPSAMIAIDPPPHRLQASGDHRQQLALRDDACHWLPGSFGKPRQRSRLMRFEIMFDAAADHHLALTGVGTDDPKLRFRGQGWIDRGA